MSLTARQILESAPRRFRPEKAQDFETNFHFIISGDENFELTIMIKKGNCSSINGLQGEATCTIKAPANAYIGLETGKLNPQMALISGQVKVSDIAAMIRFAKCFRKFDEQDVAVNNDSVASTILSPKIRNKRTGPLEGVRILDFTRLLPGPMATMMLADMGADVIKVEDPDSPDYVRSFEPMIEGNSVYYYALNRNKRSFAINFLSEKGKAIIIEMIKDTDVFIEQYRPGVMKQFGLDYETLKAINPSLIYVSISGYGHGSNMSLAAGHDINYISIAGALGITGDENGEPLIPGFQLADVAGGSYMTINAVTAALYKREKTQTGEWIDLAMTDGVLPFIALPFAAYQAKRKAHERGRFQISGGQANYNIYKCADGKYLALGSLEPKFWNKVCDRLERPQWKEKITADAPMQMQVRNELRQVFLQKTRDEWCEFFKDDDVCITPVNELDEISSNKHLNERKLFIDFQVGNTEIKTIAQPIKFASIKEANNWIAPQLGEDTTAILKEMRLTDEMINALIKEKIIKTT